MTAGTSVGGGDFQGMSGGANDFMQVLQKVAGNGSLVKKGDPVAEFDPQYQQQRLKSHFNKSRTETLRVPAERRY